MNSIKEKIPYIESLGNGQCQVIDYAKATGLRIVSVYTGSFDNCKLYTKALKMKETAEKRLEELSK